MTEMVLVQRKASSTSFSSIYLNQCVNSSKSAEFIESSKMKTDSLKDTYRYSPFTKTIVEIDPSQAWFWSPEWLNGELEVEKEIVSGKTEIFDNIEDIFNLR